MFSTGHHPGKLQPILKIMSFLTCKVTFFPKVFSYFNAKFWEILNEKNIVADRLFFLSFFFVAFLFSSFSHYPDFEYPTRARDNTIHWLDALMAYIYSVVKRGLLSVMTILLLHNKFNDFFSIPSCIEISVVTAQSRTNEVPFAITVLVTIQRILLCW